MVTSEHQSSAPAALAALSSAAGPRSVPFAPCPLLPFFDERLYLYAMIREDVRGGGPLESRAIQERFAAWWILTGKDDLPDHALTAEGHACLLEPVGTVPGTSLPITRVILAPLAHLPEARAWLEPDGTVGLKYMAWFLLAAVPMFRLDGLLSAEHRQWLDSPAGPQAPNGFTVLASLLLTFRPDLGQRFSAGTPAGLQSFVAWLRDGGLDQSGLGAYARPQRQGPYVSARRGAIPAPSRTRGVNLIGYADAELGIGEDLRTTASALETAGIPFSVFNLELDAGISRGDGSVMAHAADDLPFEVNLFCITGYETGRLMVQHGPAMFAGRRNIGCWPWELPRWPAELKVVYSLVDELWASSRFTADCFRRDGIRPVRHMPLTVLPPPAIAPARGRFGLPPDRFLFLFNFDVSSYMARKNPFAAVQAFRRAFPIGERDEVGLVVKAMRGGGDSPAWSRLMEAVREDPRIFVINEVLDRSALFALYASCDAYVSLHRAEGFGRTMAEAMLLGLPVIATGWSGNADFVTPETGWPVRHTLIPVGPDEYPFGLGTEWADPDPAHAAACMRAVAAGGPEVQARRAAARRLIADTLSPAARGRAIAARLEEIWAGGAGPVAGQLP